MDEDEVVIVGPDGTEHVFPAGFNPARAAAIVRGGSATLPTKPVSAEDFTDPTAGIQTPTLGGFGKKLAGSVAGLVKGLVQTGMDTRPEDVAAGPMAAFAPFARSAVRGAVSEADKAVHAPTTSEAMGHAAAAVIPMAGPAAASAGERLGTGDIEGGAADATTLLAPMALAKIAPRMAPSLASIGEQLASKGKTLATKAGPAVAEVAKTVPMEVAAHYLGAPLGSGAVARIVARNIMQAAKRGAKAEAPVAPAPPAVEPVAAPEVPAKASAVAQQLNDSLEALKAAPKPARAPAAPPAATIGPRNYFLKPTAAAPAESAPATAGIDVAELPTSWRGRTGPEPIPEQGVAGQQLAEFARGLLQDRGLSVGQALMQVAKDKTLTTTVRLQLMDAIKRSGRMPAEAR